MSSITEESLQRHPSTPNAEKHFHLTRENSLIESADGFTNFNEILQHLQTAWNNHHHHHHHHHQHQPSHENPRRPPNEHGSGSNYRGYSHQHSWNNYNNNPRRGGGHYSRGYSSAASDSHWNNPKGNRYSVHRPTQQQSPPIQRRPQDHHNDYKKNRSNGYVPQQSSVDYSSSSHHSIPNLSSTSVDASNLSSTQSYPSHLNSYNR